MYPKVDISTEEVEAYIHMVLPLRLQNLTVPFQYFQDSYKMLRLSEIEKACQLMSDEIERHDAG